MPSIPPRTGGLLNRWHRLRAEVASAGLGTTLGLKIRSALGKTGVFTLHPPRSAFPLTVRRGTSDRYVLHQIFIETEYDCLDDLADVSVVLDCGANVGYSSAYFLSQFPKCRVISVEPDPQNFAALERNLAPFGDRVTKIRAGVWSHRTRLSISSTPYRDGLDWSRQVQEVSADDGGFDGVDIDYLMQLAGADRISILKMDVEGAEAVIFAGDHHGWLDKVDTIAIELHEDSSFGNGAEVFFKAIEGQGFQVSRSGELTICRRPKPSQ